MMETLANMDITALVPALLAVVTAIASIVTYFGSLRRQPSPPEELSNPDRRLHPHPHDALETRESMLRQELLMRRYHDQSLKQSTSSFWFSLMFAAAGFFLIAAAVLQSDTDVTAKTTLSMISGVVIESVSALFFVQSNKARQLMITFFDKLRADRKLEEALRMASDLPDQVLRSRLQVVLALNFAETKVPDELLGEILMKARRIPSVSPDNDSVEVDISRSDLTVSAHS